MDGLDFACIEEDERLSLEEEFMKEEEIGEHTSELQSPC